WFFAISATLLAALAVHVALSLPQHKYVSQALVLTGLFILFFTSIAPDALSVKLNVMRAEKSTDKIMDAFPLFNQLSAEAYTPMIAVLENENLDIGLKTGTTIGTYCKFLENTVADEYELFVPYQENDVIFKDFETRVSRKQFYENWHSEKSGKFQYLISNSDWRTWNFARSRIPQINLDEIDRKYLQLSPYSTEELISYCINLH
ncbi:hypothetical protein KJ766_00825, partial [Patescibacteria group bacterium]|nr:hypothetical protein [Patescibacteria group bacterium]